MSERRRYHAGDMPGRLLREARGMLDEGGLKQLSLRALAARAGITAGSMYHHYDSKAALLADLAAGGFMQLRTELEQADRDAVRPGRLRAWAAAYFDFARREPALFGLMFDPQFAEAAAVAAARAEALAVLQKIVADVAATLGRTDRIDQVTLAVWAAAHGAAALEASTPGRPGFIDEVIVGLEALFRPA